MRELPALITQQTSAVYFIYVCNGSGLLGVNCASSFGVGVLPIPPFSMPPGSLPRVTVPGMGPLGPVKVNCPGARIESGEIGWLKATSMVGYDDRLFDGMCWPFAGLVNSTVVPTRGIWSGEIFMFACTDCGMGVASSNAVFIFP